MNRALSFYRTSVGKKVVMAVSGFALIAFVIQHMIGHLGMFAGREAYNAYAAFLQSLGGIKWAARVGLLLLLVVHVVSALAVSRQSKLARPVAYQRKVHLETNRAALTMRYGGIALLAFIVYHLLHFTFRVTGPGYSATDVYGNMVMAFQVPWILGVYVAAMVALGLHLYHGVWSMLQTLGVDYPAIAPLRRKLAPAIAVITVVGYLSVPLAIAIGLIK